MLHTYPLVKTLSYNLKGTGRHPFQPFIFYTFLHQIHNERALAMMVASYSWIPNVLPIQTTPYIPLYIEKSPAPITT